MSSPTSASHQALVRCYLDVDGVIAPYVAPREVTGSRPDLRERFVAGRVVTYSPMLLKGIANLRVEVVWCTTWGALAEEGFGQELGTAPRRTLDVAAAPLGGAGPKASAIANDLNHDPSPFIWIDDDAITVDARRALATTDLPMLLLSPDRRCGLQPHHLQGIAAFVDQPSPEGPSTGTPPGRAGWKT